MATPRGSLGLSNMVQNFLGAKQHQEQKAEQSQMKDLFSQMLTGDDPNTFSQLAQLNPELALQGQQYVQGQAAAAAEKQQVLDDERDKADLMQLASATDPMLQNQILEARIADITAAGGDPSDSQMLLSMPAEQRANWIAMAIGEAGLKMPGVTGVDIGTYNPRDYTVDSFAEFVSSKDPSKLQRYAPMKKTEVGGITYFADDAGQLFLPVVQDEAGNVVEATDDQIQSNEAKPAPAPITAEEQIQTEADLAAARTTATEEAKTAATLSAKEQGAWDSAEKTRSTVSKILNSPALSSNVFTGALGLGSKTPAVPGTPEADFKAFHETLTAQQFSNQIKTMVGMGSLSDAEGKKIAASAASLELGMSPEAYKQTLNEILASLDTIKEPGTYSDPSENTVSWEDLD